MSDFAHWSYIVLGILNVLAAAWNVFQCMQSERVVRLSHIIGAFLNVFALVYAAVKAAML